MSSLLFNPQLFNHDQHSSQLDTLQERVRHNVATAMAEDIGQGDVTARLIAADETATASIISREPAVVCGIAWADACFRSLDTRVNIDWHLADGELIRPNQSLGTIRGNARALLTAERCALNFLQTLSATATQTRRYVDAIGGTQARIMDTRKTLPGLRLAQKYAVATGGGMNQRLGLYDGILIKENHIAAAGSIDAVLQAAHYINADQLLSIQLEVETLAQLEAALTAGAKLILLDNFDIAGLSAAVRLNANRAILEASGSVTLDNVHEIALTGVDRISIGSLTKHVHAIDLSMRFEDTHHQAYSAK